MYTISISLASICNVDGSKKIKVESKIVEILPKVLVGNAKEVFIGSWLSKMDIAKYNINDSNIWLIG